MKHGYFDNPYYKDDWTEKSKITGRPYRQGTFYEQTDGSYAIFDGANGFMGTLSKTLEIEYNGEKTEYKEGFMRSAKEQIRKEQLK